MTPRAHSARGVTVIRFEGDRMSIIGFTARRTFTPLYIVGEPIDPPLATTCLHRFGLDTDTTTPNACVGGRRIVLQCGANIVHNVGFFT